MVVESETGIHKYFNFSACGISSSNWLPVNL